MLYVISFVLALIAGTVAATVGSLYVSGSTDIATMIAQNTEHRLDWLILFWMPTVMVFFAVFTFTVCEIEYRVYKKYLDR